MKIEKFLKQFVNIEYSNEHKVYCYKPFHMMVETKNNEIHLFCIADIQSVGDCYFLAWKELGKEAKRVYLAIDFPPAMDMEHDFVAFFQFDQSKETVFSLVALPYDSKTGERFVPIAKSESLMIIASEFVKAGKYLRFSNVSCN